MDFLKGTWPASQRLPPKVVEFFYFWKFKQPPEKTREMDAEECDLFMKMLITAENVIASAKTPNI